MGLRDEWPTLSLLTLTYGAFAALTLYAGALPLVVVIAGLAVIIAMHSSLQHEVLHGHPFQTQWLSDLTALPALGLFVPYLRFKDTHLAHHHDPNLTDPYDDPESNFLDQATWQNMPPWMQSLARFNNTLIGRMAVGPAISLYAFYRDDWGLLWRFNRRVVLSYLVHGLSVALVLAWLLGLADVPLWAYGIAAYLAMSLLKIRTYLEHRAHDRASARSVIIEDRGPLALLFLNNNYHAVHHAHPKVTWHKLPQMFEARRDYFLTRNGGYSYRSYVDVFAQYLFEAKDPVPHPTWTVSNRTKPSARG
ncbi:MAG: fatty acid desaturase [Pseudomonadota bacterium]